MVFICRANRFSKKCYLLIRSPTVTSTIQTLCLSSNSSLKCKGNGRGKGGLPLAGLRRTNRARVIRTATHRTVGRRPSSLQRKERRPVSGARSWDRVCGRLPSAVAMGGAWSAAESRRVASCSERRGDQHCRGATSTATATVCVNRSGNAANATFSSSAAPEESVDAAEFPASAVVSFRACGVHAEPAATAANGGARRMGTRASVPATAATICGSVTDFDYSDRG